MQTDDSIIASLIGRQIGDHRIDALLAQGGMGLIFRAVPVDSTKARTCVLKVLHSEYRQNPELCRRFMREGRILEPLQHPNIVNMTQCQEDPAIGPYMLMETLQGQTLKELTRARQKPFPPEKIIDWVQQLCQALHYCHRQEVIHRDIKPTNIFINSPDSQIEQVKLLDFGIAASPREPDAPGERVGTPRYMAPEQIHCQPVTGQSDLYALGVVLFELLTRRPLFQTLDSDELRQAHLTQAPPKLHEARPDLIYPEALEALVQRMLSKDPAGRPSSAASLYQDLTTVFAEEKIRPKEGRLGIVVGTGANPAEAILLSDAPTPPPGAAPVDETPAWDDLFGPDAGDATSPGVQQSPSQASLPQMPQAIPSGEWGMPPQGTLPQTTPLVPDPLASALDAFPDAPSHENGDGQPVGSQGLLVVLILTAGLAVVGTVVYFLFW